MEEIFTNNLPLNHQGPVVHSIVSLTSSCQLVEYLRYLSLNFNEMLTNDVVSFEQPVPVNYLVCLKVSPS